MDESSREEENNNQSNNGSWWGSWPTWLQSAKEKSSTALEFMKRDLAEFSQVVQTDAVAAVSSTAAMLKEKLTVDNAEAVADRARQSITSVIGSIADVFVPHKELEDGELMIIKNSEPVIMDWWQSQLYLIQKDPKTFCHEPEGPPEMYENWLESFDPNEHQEEMTEIMMMCSDVRNIYDKLVPTSVSHLEFWQRYFYRVHLLKKTNAKRTELMRQVDQISIEDIEWDKDNEISTEDSISSHDGKETANVSVSDSNPSFQSVVTSHPKPNQNTSVASGECNSTQRTACIGSVEEADQQTVSDIVPEDTLPKSDIDKTENSDASNISSEVLSEPSSADSTDGSRSSPIESLGKDYSTGDEWEKDFDIDINENDLKNLNLESNPDSNKEEEDDWEKWQ